MFLWFTGAAYGGAENSIKNLLHRTKFPFLPTPMAKGLIPDDDELSVAPARSRSALPCSLQQPL